MKTRESGMPEEKAWAAFFDPAAILARLGLDSEVGDLVEFGCGYGTFTIPAARVVAGCVHTFDIEPEMVERTRAKAAAAGLANVTASERDFVEDGLGLPDGSADYAMLFNILHARDPLALLRQAFCVLAPGGKLGIIHWRHDPTTPRGPPMNIRPTPAQCRAHAEEAGFRAVLPEPVDLPPYHYGLLLRKDA